MAVEAAQLRASPKGLRSGDDLDFVRASLEVKAATAARIGRMSLARLATPAPSSRRLAARLERNAARADAALRASMISPVAESAARRPAARPRLAGWLAGAAAAAVAAAAVVMLPSIIGSSDGTREQTLSGVRESSGGATIAASALASPRPTIEPSPRSSAPTTILSASFDEVRMNSGLGPGWSGSGGEEAAEVAPVPNAVNRSARLTATDSTSEACTELQAGSEDLAATVDVMIATGVARAIVSLESTTGHLTAAFGAEGSTLSADAAPAVEFEGITPGDWYRSVIRLTNEGDWELTPLSGEAATQSAPLDDAEGFGAIVRVCIGAEGDAGSAAHFDNLTITEGGTDS